MATQSQSRLSLAITRHLCANDDVCDEPNLPMEDSCFMPDSTLLEEALENSLDCVAIVDMQGTVVYMNMPGVCQLDLEQQPFVERVCWSDLWSRDCTDLAEYSIESARAGRPCRFTAHRASRQGAEKWWDVAVTPVLDGYGNPVQAFCIARDITELKRSALESKQTLVTEINHRVKNSLTAVASLLSLQARRAPDENVRASLQQARTRIIAVAEVHRHLYEAGDETVDLGECVSAIARESVATLSAEKNVRLHLACPHGIALHADRAITLALVTTELVTNCMKHAFQNRDGLVQVALYEDASGLALHVDDDGCGLPEDFDPVKNAGVGMKVVLSLINQLHGELKVERRRPGAHFRVLLPWKSSSVS